MQSLDIKRPAERSSRAIASAVLINCPTAAAVATTIPSGYFISTVSTNYSISTVLDLYRCWIYFTASSARSTVPPNYSDRPIPFYYFHRPLL
jgi:hypothetical protein